MHQPAFQPNELEDEEALDVEDDDGLPDESSARSGDGVHSDPRYSHVAKRDRSTDSLIPRDGSIIGNRYRIESASQRDGATIVLRAHHLELGTKAFIRYLSPRAARRGNAVNRFLRGARAAARVHSEHVARVTDIGRFGLGLPFIVTEAAEGWTLEEVLRVRGPLPVQEAVEYVVQAGSGVAAAHAAGVLHGSINLRHLVLSRRVDGSPLVRVEALGAAAGLAADFSSEPEPSGASTAVEAAVPFLAPEQVRDAGDVDVRADVWALGAVLHTLLCGSPPFQGNTAPAVLASIAADSPAPLGHLQRDIAPGLESAVLQCLSKDREERFASIADLLVALRPFASGDAVAVLDRVSRSTTRPPPLPGTIPTSRPLPPPNQPRPIPLTEPRKGAIVPMSRPPAAPEPAKQSYIAGAAAVGAGVGAGVALVLAVLLRVSAPVVVAPAMPMQPAMVAAPGVAAAPVVTAAAAPAAPGVAVAPVAAVAQAPAVAPVITPAVAPPASAPPAVAPRPVVRKADVPRAEVAAKSTTPVAGKSEAVAGRSERDLFDDPR